MRIDPNVAIQPAALDTQKAQVPARAVATPGLGETSASVVALSPVAAQAVSEPQPSITSRIEKLRSLLERGAFPVDLDVLAARIVDDEVLRAGKPT
jgi:anti-sigma28 factor (negative regulator of flagellin synthesis)